LLFSLSSLSNGVQMIDRVVVSTHINSYSSLNSVSRVMQEFLMQEFYKQ
jgi:hypothetical protein